MLSFLHFARISVGSMFPVPLTGVCSQMLGHASRHRENVEKVRFKRSVRMILFIQAALSKVPEIALCH